MDLQSFWFLDSAAFILPLTVISFLLEWISLLILSPKLLTRSICMACTSIVSSLLGFNVILIDNLLQEAKVIFPWLLLGLQHLLSQLVPRVPMH